MKGLCLDSGEFIPADELNAKWIPRKATEEEMSNVQTEALPVLLAKRLCDGISTGHDWPNTDDELLRMQSASELRRLAAVEQELEALKRAISDAEPVAHIYVGGIYGNELQDWEIEPEHGLCEKLNEDAYRRSEELTLPLYTLKGIK